MNWKIEITPTAEKCYLKLDKKTRKRIKRALLELEQEDPPLLYRNVEPRGLNLRTMSRGAESRPFPPGESREHRGVGVRLLTGKLRGDYRLRIGGWRILFTPDKDKKIIYIYA
ncbi:MAG: type II toxin-antitoxin system RelE/ParE family toxin, partial [Caldiserica bacterium]|nr:type II toxin-antitoxin system RelE/ParE family toxin [Caldisericota bacterium]